MSLATDLSTANATNRSRIPAPALQVMDKVTANTHVSPLAVDDEAPNFTLPNAQGGSVILADLVKKGPVVLAFYRGGWCPYCNLELKALQGMLPQFEQAGATLVAVSPQTPDNSLSTVEKDELSFPVLSDSGNEVASRYGLVWTIPESLRSIYTQFGIDIPVANGDGTFTLPVPGTFVIDRNCVVRYAFADADYTKRAEPSDVLAALRALS